MPKPVSVSVAEAEVIALKLLTFLASDPDRLGAFLAASGLGPGDLRSGARDNHFLAGVVDYLLADESLLLNFAESAGVEPGTIVAARRLLPGGSS